MIKILTDSTADIPKALQERYQIEIIPMYVQLDGKVYRDGEDLDAEMMFRKVKDTGQYPTTSAPPPSDYAKFFDRDMASIYIGVSSALSSAFQNAQLAVKSLGKKSIDLIDSLSFSTGYGQVVIKAAEWRGQGLSFEELGKQIRDLVRRSRGIFVLDNLDYLFHGGRCSAIQHFVGSLLKIHPFLNVLPDGNLGILQKVRGSRQKAVNALLNYFKNELKKYRIKRIFITQLGCEEDAQYLAEEIEGLDFPIEIMRAEIGCALASHSGPKPLGIAYTIE